MRYTYLAYAQLSQLSRSIKLRVLEQSLSELLQIYTFEIAGSQGKFPRVYKRCETQGCNRPMPVYDTHDVCIACQDPDHKTMSVQSASHFHQTCSSLSGRPWIINNPMFLPRRDGQTSFLWYSRVWTAHPMLKSMKSSMKRKKLGNPLNETRL